MKIDKKKLHEIIIEAYTTGGKIFDISLIILILISILLVKFDSVPSIHERFLMPLRIAEILITIIFSIEYILRIYVVKKPARL